MFEKLRKSKDLGITVAAGKGVDRIKVESQKNQRITSQQFRVQDALKQKGEQPFSERKQSQNTNQAH